MDSSRETGQPGDEVLKSIGVHRPFEGFILCHLKEVYSTQDRGWEFLREGKRGAIVIADRQLAGRGRHGKKWHGGVSGNVYLSVAIGDWKFNCDLASFAFRFAEKICETFSAKLSTPLEAKAPNDLMLNGKKVGGILVEAAGIMAVIGVGLNLVHDENLQSQCSQPVGSIDAIRSLALKDAVAHICAALAETMKCLDE